jgi:hypothetical protein
MGFSSSLLRGRADFPAKSKMDNDKTGKTSHFCFIIQSSLVQIYQNKIYKSNQFIKLKIGVYKNRSLPESFFLQSFLKSDKEMAVR